MCMTHPSFDKDFHFQNCQNHILDMSCVVCFRILLSLHTVCAGGGGGGGGGRLPYSLGRGVPLGSRKSNALLG